MLVYVDPSLFVEIIITAMTPVYLFEELAVEIDVRVEVGPDTVAVLAIVMGYT